MVLEKNKIDTLTVACNPIRHGEVVRESKEKFVFEVIQFCAGTQRNRTAFYALNGDLNDVIVIRT